MRVLGIDGCAGGWIGALLEETTRPDPAVGVVRLVFGRTIGEVLGAAGVSGAAEGGSAGEGLDAVGIDIPIGLPEESARLADELARAALGPRRASIFPAPVRGALQAETHGEFSAIHRAATGAGLSVQAFGLASKIAEIDDHLRSGGRGLIEVHPELSFATLAGLPAGPRPMANAKRTWAGAEERRALLTAVGLLPRPDDPAGAHAASDDVLDAAIVAWTARRIARGEARSYPDPPEVFSDGIAAAIRA